MNPTRLGICNAPYVVYTNFMYLTSCMHHSWFCDLGERSFFFLEKPTNREAWRHGPLTVDVCGLRAQINTRWWFQIVFIFIPSWGRFPFWRIFFKWVEITNQNTTILHQKMDAFIQNLLICWVVGSLISISKSLFLILEKHFDTSGD